MYKERGREKHTHEYTCKFWISADLREKTHVLSRRIQKTIHCQIDLVVCSMYCIGSFVLTTAHSLEMPIFWEFLHWKYRLKHQIHKQNTLWAICI